MTEEAKEPKEIKEPEETKEPKEYTLDEIAEHNDRSSIYLLIHGNVYDVTKFADSHPGGEEVFIEHAGKHASEAFEEIGHSSDARELMKQFKIGELCKEDKQKITDAEEKNNIWKKSEDGESWRNWIIPIVMGILISLIYRFYLSMNA